jgi:hypothetical protein
LIELWKENGIPLHIVLRGIDRSFESAQQKRKNSPRTLFYCHPAIMEAFEEYQEATVGESESEAGGGDNSKLSKDVVLKFLDELQSQLAVRRGEVYRRVVSRLSALAAEITRRAEPDLRQVDRDLTEISSMLTDGLRKELSDDCWKSILTESQQAVKIYKKHLAPNMFERLKQKQIEKTLREYFDLPEFSLLHLE